MTPQTAPAKAITLKMKWLGYSAKPASQPASQGCAITPESWATLVVQGFTNFFTLASNVFVDVQVGQKVTLIAKVTYRADPGMVCFHQRADLINVASFGKLKPKLEGYLFNDTALKYASAVPLSLLPDLPYCLNLTANVNVNVNVFPTSVHDSTTPPPSP